MPENEKAYLYVTTPLDGSTRKFSLINLSGYESISEPFCFTLEMVALDNSINFKDLLGKSICATIEFYNEKKRYINGIVTKFYQSGNDYLNTTYIAEINPWLWELSLTADCRIFQNKSVIEIIKQVFSDNGFSDFKDSTSSSYESRVYCVQYNETTLNFVSRLMEEEGIYYYFEHTDSKHNLILIDSLDSHKSCPDFSDAKMKTTSLNNDDKIINCNFENQLTTNQFALSDYNFETPSNSLLSNSQTEGISNYKVYNYPGKFSKSDEGTTLTKKRVEKCNTYAKRLDGTSNCRAFIAGYKFKITEHDRNEYNDEYILDKVEISVNQKEYINNFSAFPSSTQYRAKIKTVKPKIYGSQTALVVGKSGEEIWTDKYGRIKVQFYWDQLGKKDENSSCWIRVGQTWGGKGWGSWFIPRIGMEVIVSFLDGDPDRPLVTGCVYNASQTLPYELPANQNISTISSRSTKDGSAGNEIKFDDTKDSELFYMHAQKDMQVEVENERTTTIKESNETLTVKKGDRTITVETGKEVHSVKSTREVTVEGNETHENKADFTHNVKGNYTLNVDGNFTLKVKGSISIKSDMDISTKAGTSISNESGTDFSNKAGTTMDNKASVSMTNDGGTQLTDKASAMVKIDGGGMLEAKGGIIKLN